MTQRKYRFVGRNRFKTRWRDLPKDGLPRPRTATAEKLGEGYGVEIRTPSRKKQK
jgi:hypothetical protein